MTDHQPEAPAVPGVTRWRTPRTPPGVVREAVRLMSGNLAEVSAWVRSNGRECLADGTDLLIGTPGDYIRAIPGEWVVRNPDSSWGFGHDVFPAETFAETYEPAEVERTPAVPPPPADTELASLKSACRLLGRSVVGQVRAMQAARIELARGDAKAGMQWILNSLPDVWDDPETEWDGKESADEWWDRTDDFYRAEREPAESPAPGPLILPPDEFRAVQVVAAVLGVPGSASEPDGPGEAGMTAFQARWPVTASVLRSQVRAAIEHWASGDAGDEDPAGVVMAVVAPFMESMVTEGLRIERDRADAAEAKLCGLEIAVTSGDALIREILEALCLRDGLPMESSVVPGEPARNYDLAIRLGIGHVFGIKETPGA